MRVAVVILNWNGKAFLEKFLPSVVHTSRDIAEIVVADNDSTDDSVAFLHQHFPEIKIILNKSNLGFASGYNAALREVKSEFYVLLNSDVEVTENWIPPVIELLDKNQRIAACQPKIRSYHQQEKFEYAGAAGGFIDKYGYPFCRGRIFSSIEKDDHQYDDAKEIFWATGACLFIRASVFQQLGGFDDEFFAHMEEIDLCWRIHTAGFQIMYCPGSTVFHVGGGTLPKDNPRKTYFNFRNNLMMIYKNADPKKLHSILLFRTIFDLVAAVHFLFTNGWKDCRAVLQAHSYFRHYKKRNPRRVAGSATDTSVQLIYPKSILFSYFIFRKKKFTDLTHFR